MKARELIEILELDIEDSENVQELFITFLTYLEETIQNKFDIERPRFFVLSEKLLSIVKHHYPSEYSQGLEKALLSSSESLDKLIIKHDYSDASSLLQELLSLPVISLSWKARRKCSELAKELEDIILSTFNAIKTIREEKFSFYNLYIPKNANKLDAERFVREAIEIIRNDYSLSDEAKRKIISHLESALISLQRGNTSNFFGTIKEAIIILGALGSLAGGYYAAIAQAQQKLNDATNILETTSINQNDLILGYHTSYLRNMAILPPDLDSLPQSSEANIGLPIDSP
jgi:hypothetical protein